MGLDNIYSGYQITNTKRKLSYPVTIEALKDQICIAQDDLQENDMLESYIKAATAEAEHKIQKDIAFTEVTSQVWDFSGDGVQFWEAPFHSIDSIYRAEDPSTALTYDPKETRSYYEYWKLVLTSSTSADPLYVTYYTGWEPADCPAEIALAIKIRAADYYDVERQSYIPGSLKENKAFDRLLSFYMSTVTV